MQEGPGPKRATVGVEKSRTDLIAADTRDAYQTLSEIFPDLNQECRKKDDPFSVDGELELDESDILATLENASASLRKALTVLNTEAGNIAIEEQVSSFDSLKGLRSPGNRNLYLSGQLDLLFKMTDIAKWLALQFEFELEAEPSKTDDFHARNRIDSLYQYVMSSLHSSIDSVNEAAGDLYLRDENYVAALNDEPLPNYVHGKPLENSTQRDEERKALKSDLESLCYKLRNIFEDIEKDSTKRSLFDSNDFKERYEELVRCAKNFEDAHIVEYSTQIASTRRELVNTIFDASEWLLGHFD